MQCAKETILPATEGEECHRSRDTDIDAYIRGPVDSVAGTVVTILGQSINVSGLAFEDQDGNTISEAAFISAAQNVIPVKIHGELSVSAIILPG